VLTVPCKKRRPTPQSVQSAPKREYTIRRKGSLYNLFGAKGECSANTKVLASPVPGGKN